MALLGTTKLQSIQKKSANAISVFQKTVTDLVSINAQIDKEDAVRVKEAEVLKARTDARQAEIAQDRYDLDLAKIQNTKIIDKVNEFIGVG